MLIEIANAGLVLGAVICGTLILFGGFSVWHSKMRPHHASRAAVQQSLTSLARYGSALLCFSLCFAFFALVYSFVISDLRLAVVASNSHTLKPLLYKISGTWGNHEGSFLLWNAMFALVAFLAIRQTMRCQGRVGATASLTEVQHGVHPDDVTSKANPTSPAPIPVAYLAYLLIGLSTISMMFVVYLLSASNPFERLLVVPHEGLGLNPLLQHFGLAIHPPLLYGGYVCLAVVFAHAFAAMRTNFVTRGWAALVMPWVTIGWTFLTAGIALGSWWAYNELGWGGYWFWDPVENTALMPWLLMTALLHSLIVLRRKDAFHTWTLLLALLGYLFCLVGLFLVRSGLLTSVHAFATDSTRGIWFMSIFAITALAGTGFLCFYSPPESGRDATSDTPPPGLPSKSTPIGSGASAFSTQPSQSQGAAVFPVTPPSRLRSILEPMFERQYGMVLNNYLLVSAAVIILIGTLYPYVAESILHSKLSIGAPWFNTTVVPLFLVAALLASIFPYARWRLRSSSATAVSPRQQRKIWVILGAFGIGTAVFAAIVLVPPPASSDVDALSSLRVFGLGKNIGIVAGFGCALALLVSGCMQITTLWRQRPVGARAFSVTPKLLRDLSSSWGMILGHLALGVVILGIVLAEGFSVSKTLVLTPQQADTFVGYEVHLREERYYRAQNYFVREVSLEFRTATGTAFVLKPSLFLYPPPQQTVTSEADIHTNGLRDLYAVLGNTETEGTASQGQAAETLVQLHYRPGIPLIWFGVMLGVIGGLAAFFLRKKHPVG
ncbi:MAG: cytochrome c biogenesis protein CcsA [Alphaproteobacteria bacterium]|nr:cytochrome c biogenesis protein CcsA [Alphaproteobacteria bacterium]